MAHTSNLLYLLAIFVVLAFFTGVSFKRRLPSVPEDEQWPFHAKRPLTTPEQALYHRLVDALPECIVLAQVQLSQVLGVKKGFNRQGWNNRINRMSYDFLICSKDFSVIAAIELDDQSHRKPSRIEDDAKKERATSAAGIPLIRWQVSALPDVSTIRAILATHRRPDPALGRTA